jgi:predicted Zn-dependent protease
VDVNSLFARAEQAFVGGRLEAARRDLDEVRRAAGDHPTVLHLLALVEKKSGRASEARAAFARAAALAPGDPQIAANFANLLGETGEAEEALKLYGRALAARPAFREARYNRALLLQRMGRLEESLADLDACLAQAGKDARAHSARGGVLRQLGRFDEAAGAYDAALALAPDRLVALHGRARVAMERGEDGASAFYRRALALKPDDLELALGLAEALEAEGEAEGLEVLTEAVKRHPEWVLGHEVLARMRSEAGEAEHFADHYLLSIARRPADRALHLSHWQSLARGQKHALALQALEAAKYHIGEDPQTRLMAAVFTSESGDPRRALEMLDALGGAESDPSVQFARGRIALRAGDAEQAAEMFGRVTAAQPEGIGNWAHLDLAWRLIGDRRHEWLSGQPGLYGHRDLGLSEGELDALAVLLRSLHRTRAHPIGQSLRGGTQTRGRLFARREPEIVRLRDAILAAVEDHRSGLPPRDPTHPLLRHRDSALALTGSWSVRLVSQGFHVNHIHPEGVLSSACYISLPETLGGADTRDGWLELGRPPVELGLPLEPLAAIEPKPGRLALFPSYLFHGTRPFADGERLTVAFDVVPR